MKSICSKMFVLFLLCASWSYTRAKKGCNIETGVYIGAGSNVKQMSTSGQEECSSFCASTDGCVAWTMRTSSGYCWLNSDDSSKGQAEGWITGTKECGRKPEFSDGTCYKDDRSRLLDDYHTTSTMTPFECILICASGGFSYAGVQNENECYCGNDEPPAYRIRDSSECDDKCDGDHSLICGGGWRMNVYKTEKMVEKLSNAIQSTLANPPSTRDTTSERSKMVQMVQGGISANLLSVDRTTDLYKILKDLFLKIVAKPKLDEYFPNFVPSFQHYILPTVIQEEDLNSPLLKAKLVTPFPKPVEDSAQLEDKEVTINGTFVDRCPWGGKCPYHYKTSNWISTHLYAKQGQLVTVTVPENLAGKFAIRVNVHTDDVTKKNMKTWKKGKTSRRPCIITQLYKKEIIKPKTRLLTPYGGLIFIDIGKPPSALGEFTLKFENVITSLRFKQGETTSEEWSKAVASSKSPMVEMEVPGLIVIFPKSYVDEKNVDVEQVASQTTKMMNAIHKMQGYIIPRPHLYVYDVIITAGGAHAGYPIMDGFGVEELKIMEEMEENEYKQGIWAMPHEIGHTLEWKTYTPSGLVQVICNIFAQYANEVAFKGANPHGVASLRFAEKFKKEDKQFSSVGFFGRLNIFKMVQQECSWSSFISFFKFYNEEIPTELIPKNTYEGYSLITRVLSEKCNKNLIPFFKWWNWPVLVDAVEATKDLPKWEGIIQTLESGTRNYLVQMVLDTDTYGFDMESKKVKSENECADWCGTTRGCTFWTLRKKDNLCWLKNGDLYTIKREGFISGGLCGLNNVCKADLPKNGNWNLLFRQTLFDEEELFKKNEWTRNKGNVDAPNYSILGDFEKFRKPDGSFHLFLWYPELGTGNEWIQTSNPLTKTSGGVDNYKAILTPFTGYYWGGLEHNNDEALLDGSIHGSWWCYAVGATKLYGGGIPGPKDDKAYRVVKKVELYIDYPGNL